MKCLNMYDVRLYDDMGACGTNWPPDLAPIYTYLRVSSRLCPFGVLYSSCPSQRPDVIRAIHATDAASEWTECRGNIHRNFSTRHSNASFTLLPRVLEKIPVMIFAGDQDLICNYVGLENMMQSMTWNGATGLGVRLNLLRALRERISPVSVDCTNTVMVRRRLTSGHMGELPQPDLREGMSLVLSLRSILTQMSSQYQIFNASHMAGYDVPHVTHDMILRFMGVNFTALTDGSARIPSVVGSDSKPVPTLLDEQPTTTPVSGKTPEQDKAMWEGAHPSPPEPRRLFDILFFS